MRHILVTGGATGIGAGVSRALVGAGHAVTLTFRHSAAEAEALRVELTRAGGPPVRAVALDLADKVALDAFCKDVDRFDGDGFGPVDGLVHNAGQSYDTLSMMLDQTRAEAAMQVNFWSLTQLVGALARPMMARRFGRFMAIGSVTAERSNQGNAAYGASKAAVHAYMRTLAIETAKRGVTANVIAPGFVDTAMMAKYASHRAGMEKQIPAGRFAQADEIGALAAFLVGDSAGYITGATIPVDGGLSASMGLQRG